MDNNAMVYVPVSNTLQTEIRGTLSGEEVEITLYFSRGDTIEASEVLALHQWLEDVFIPDWIGWCSNNLTIDEIYSTDLTTSTSPTYPYNLDPDQIGGEALATSSANCACCVSFRTNNRGRSSRGRNYVPAIPEANITGNSISLTTINGLVAAYELCLGGGTFPAGWDWVVVSRFFEGVARIAGLIQTIVDVLSTDVLVDSQRKRVK